MTWLIIILAVLLITAPIYSLLPSAKQKHQMAMRREAMAEGIGVDLTQIEDPDPAADKYLSATGRALDRVISVAAYRLNRQVQYDWRQQQPIEWCLIRTGLPDSGLADGWQWQGDIKGSISGELKDFVENRLGSLPDGVIRIDEINSTLSVYWNESDEAGALGRVLDFLKECVQVTSLRTDGDQSREQ